MTIFIVAGRTGRSLVKAKVSPFAIQETVDKIYIFCESGELSIEKCTCITIPASIRKIRPVLLSKVVRFVYEPFQLLWYALKYKPDAINGIYCLPKGLNSFIVSAITGTKCFNSIIGSRLEIETELPLKGLWRRLNLFQLRRCDALTIKGENDRAYLVSNGVKEEKLFLFNGAVDASEFSFNTGQREIDILFVGSFIELKGIDRIIRISGLLRNRIPGLKVVLVGDGILLQRMKKLAADLCLSDAILFEGFRQNTADYFRNSKILLMPSRSESLPTSMLEAMACGCVPVISNVGNVTEATYDRVNSRVIDDYNDINAFSDAAFGLLNNEELRSRYALSGRRVVEEKYSVLSQAALAGRVLNYIAG